MDVVLEQAGLRPPRSVSLALATSLALAIPKQAPPDVERLMSYRLLKPSFTVASLRARINAQRVAALMNRLLRLCWILQQIRIVFGGNSWLFPSPVRISFGEEGARNKRDLNCVAGSLGLDGDGRSLLVLWTYSEICLVSLFL